MNRENLEYLKGGMIIGAMMVAAIWFGFSHWPG